MRLGFLSPFSIHLQVVSATRKRKIEQLNFQFLSGVMIQERESVMNIIVVVGGHIDAYNKTEP
jgi:hypothetical protein